MRNVLSKKIKSVSLSLRKSILHNFLWIILFYNHTECKVVICTWVLSKFQHTTSECLGSYRQTISHMEIILTRKNKEQFFQSAVVSVLQYGCTTGTLAKHIERKLDGNYIRMLRAVLNKSWRQNPTKQQLYGHLPSISKTFQIRRVRHAEHCWGCKGKLISDVIMWPALSNEQGLGDQPELIYNNSILIQGVAWKTY